MGFLALALALMIEQGRPLPEKNFVHRWMLALADTVQRSTNAGEARHGVVGWGLICGGMMLVLSLLEFLLDAFNPIALFVLHVVVLYLTVGFRQFSHSFTAVQLALAAGDVAGARRELQDWLRREESTTSAGEADVTQICRLSIANALVASHRHVFGPLLWYLLLPGVTGPVLYRLAEMLARRWKRSEDDYGRFALRAYRAIDWPALRLSATGFAIVGNFEDAVYAWRAAVAAGLGTDQRALLLATGGGALGLRIADPEFEAAWSVATGEAGDAGETTENSPADLGGVLPVPDGLRSAVGLVWRSVVLWLALFGLLTVAGWLGR